MKKLMILLLCLTLALSLTACGGGSEDDAAEPAKEVSAAAEEPAAEPEEEAAPAEEPIQFSPVTVADNDACAVAITELDPDGLWGYTLKAELENRSSDVTYMFAVERGSVNGVECDPFWATEVAPGKKANSEISFSDTALEENGVTPITDIELTFHVYDTDDWSGDDVFRDTIHIYPLGEDKATVFVRQPKPEDNVLADTESAAVTVTGYDPDDMWGYTVNVFLENRTDKTVMFSVDEASVNGYMCDPFWAQSVGPGKCAFGAISWGSESLEENGIETVEQIEFHLSAHDEEDFSGGGYIDQTVTLTP